MTPLSLPVFSRQLYTARKKIENRLKGVTVKDAHTISAVPPEQYAARFMNFMSAAID